MKILMLCVVCSSLLLTSCISCDKNQANPDKIGQNYQSTKSCQCQKEQESSKKYDHLLQKLKSENDYTRQETASKIYLSALFHPNNVLTAVLERMLEEQHPWVLDSYCGILMAQTYDLYHKEQFRDKYLSLLKTLISSKNNNRVMLGIRLVEGSVEPCFPDEIGQTIFELTSSKNYKIKLQALYAYRSFILEKQSFSYPWLSETRYLPQIDTIKQRLVKDCRSKDWYVSERALYLLSHAPFVTRLTRQDIAQISQVATNDENTWYVTSAFFNVWHFNPALRGKLSGHLPKILAKTKDKQDFVHKITAYMLNNRQMKFSQYPKNISLIERSIDEANQLLER